MVSTTAHATVSPGTAANDLTGLRKWAQRKRPAADRLFIRTEGGNNSSRPATINSKPAGLIDGKPSIIVTISEEPVMADMNEWFSFDYMDEYLLESAPPDGRGGDNAVMRPGSSIEDLEREAEDKLTVGTGIAENGRPLDLSLVERLYQKRRQEDQQRTKQIAIDATRFGLSKTELKRQRAIYELLMTERSYVKDMQILCNLFLRKMRDKKLLGGPQGIKRVFANIEEILRVNEELHRNLCSDRKKLFEEINACMSKSTRFTVKRASQMLKDYPIGKTLNQMVPYFRNYTIYCGNHAEASEYLNRRLAKTKFNGGSGIRRRSANVSSRGNLNNGSGSGVAVNKDGNLFHANGEEQSEQDENLAAFLQYCIHRPECRRVDIFGFLIKPIQRICKYPLLIREILNNTDAGHPDRQQLTIALQTIEKVVMEVNDRRRFVEGQQQRMLELNRRLLFDETIIIGGPQEWLDQQISSSAVKTVVETTNNHSRKNTADIKVASSLNGGKGNGQPLTRKFNLFNEPSRKIINEADDVLQFYNTNNDGDNGFNQAPQYMVHRSLLLFTDVFMICRLPREPSLLTRLWTRLTRRLRIQPTGATTTTYHQPRAQVRLIVKLSEVQSVQKLDQSAVVGDKSLAIYPWSIVFNKDHNANVTVPLNNNDTSSTSQPSSTAAGPPTKAVDSTSGSSGGTVRYNTRHRQKKLHRVSQLYHANGSRVIVPRETATLIFASASEVERDQMVEELIKYSEEMKQDLEGRKRLLTRNGNARDSKFDEITKSRSLLSAGGSSLAVSSITPSPSDEQTQTKMQQSEGLGDGISIHDIPVALINAVE